MAATEVYPVGGGGLGDIFVAAAGGGIVGGGAAEPGGGGGRFHEEASAGLVAEKREWDAGKVPEWRVAVVIFAMMALAASPCVVGWLVQWVVSRKW